MSARTQTQAQTWPKMRHNGLGLDKDDVTTSTTDCDNFTVLGMCRTQGVRTIEKSRTVLCVERVHMSRERNAICLQDGE